jgi:hypothetical protein
MFGIEEQELLDAGLVEDGFGRLQGRVGRGGDQVGAGHDVADVAPGKAAEELQVAPGQDPDHLAAAAAVGGHGKARHVLLLHQLQGPAHAVLGAEGHGIVDHPVLAALDLGHLTGLLVGRQAAVDDSDAPLLGQRDGQRRLRHRVHRRGHERHVELDVAGQAGGGLGLVGQDAAALRDEQHVVEGHAFLNYLVLH